MINEHERHFDQHLANNTIVLTRRHMELFLNMRVMLGISFVCLFSAVYPKTRIDTHTHAFKHVCCHRQLRHQLQHYSY